MKRTFINIILFILLVVITFFLTKAVYEPQEEIAPLVGTWTWTNTLTPDGAYVVLQQATAFTLTFTDEYKVLGTTDCNNFFGSYNMFDNGLHFGPLGSTLMFCEGAQEYTFTEDLADVYDYTLEDGVLTLMGPGGIMYFVQHQE